MKHLKALIFDIDGTLVDSNDLHAEAWQAAFRKFGKEIEYDVVRSQIGKGGDLLVPDLLNAREMREFGEKLKEYRKKLFRSEYMQRVKPFDGVPELLGRIHDLEIELAFASSADPDEVKHYTELLGAKELLSGSTSKKDAKMSKPSPEIFDAALEQIEASDDAAMVVGDTPYDILAAHRCALPIVAVRSGGFPEETLKKAEFLFDDIAELVRRIEEVDAWFAR